MKRPRHGYPLLRPRPQVFFGREAELHSLATIISQTSSPSARICILGPPGIGKTSLALSLLHQDNVKRTFGACRFFIPCDSAVSISQLVTTLATSFNLPVPNSKGQILLFLRKRKRTIVVLDNFETTWEPQASRQKIEDFLVELDGIGSLTLVITLRGSERPAGPAWSHPFLPPLSQLAEDAAHQTFFAIANASDDHMRTVTQLLSNLDGLPLAITLLANIAQYESPAVLLERWQQQQTRMLSRGGDEHSLSSLDRSIKLSVDCERMRAISGPLMLLSIMSYLPDGLDMKLLDLLVPSLPHPPRRCMSVLLQTALAYRGAPGRIHVLAPIRAFIIRHHPPSLQLQRPILAHFYSLTELSARLESSDPPPWAEVNAALGPEIGNVEALIAHGLSGSLSNLEGAIQAAVNLGSVILAWRVGSFNLIDLALAAAWKSGDKLLIAECIFWVGYLAYRKEDAAQANASFAEALALFCQLGNVERQIDCMFRFFPSNHEEDMARMNESLRLAQSIGDLRRQAFVCLQLGIYFRMTARLPDAMKWLRLAGSLYPGDTDVARSIRCMALWHQTELELLRGHAEEAVLRARMTLETCPDTAIRRARCHFIAAHAHMLSCDMPNVISHLRAACTHFAVSGYPAKYVECLLVLVRAFLFTGDARQATHFFDELSEVVSWDPSLHKVKALRLLAMGAISSQEQDFETAHQHLCDGLALLVASRDWFDPYIHSTSLFVGATFLHLGYHQQAFNACLVATLLFRRYSQFGGVAEGALALSACLLSDGDSETAFTVTEAVLPWIQQGSMKGRMTECLIRRAEIFRIWGRPVEAEEEIRRAQSYADESYHAAAQVYCREFLMQTDDLLQRFPIGGGLV